MFLFCLTEAKRKYVLFQKIQFKSDINVNNAAVQEAILAQVGQSFLLFKMSHVDTLGCKIMN